MSSAESISWAFTLLRCANSTKRFEFELFGEPTTKIKSTSFATCSTASWRFCVA